MKYLLITLLLCIGLTAFTQPIGKIRMGVGEYCTGGVNELTHIGYDGTQGKMVPLSGAPAAGVREYIGGAHHAMLIDMNGDLYGLYDNSTGELGLGNLSGVGTATLVTVDSLGNPIHNVKQVSCGGTNYGLFWYTAILKTDGTVWTAGQVQGGNQGNGTWGTNNSKRFTQVIFPGGPINIVKIQAGYMLMALDDQGNVWTWGGGGNPNILGQGNSPTYLSPHKIAAAGVFTDIAGGSFWNYAIRNDGHTLAWGGQYYTDYTCTFPGMTQWGTVPVDITANLALPAPVKNIFINNEATHAILTDGSLWSWGGNAGGTVGNGIELDYFRYGGYPLPYGTTNPFPFNWDQGKSELQVLAPVNLAPGKFNWRTVYSSNALAYTSYAIDNNDSLYVWGRNKASIVNGVVPMNSGSGELQRVYPNSWDVPGITFVNPLAISSQIPMSSPWCKSHSTSSCTIGGAIPGGAGVIASAGVNQTISANATKLLGQFTMPSGYAVMYTVWSQVSGPTTAVFNFKTLLQPWVSGLTTGAYVFKVVMTDQSWNKDSSNVTITVGNVPPTVICSGSPNTITLPTNSTTISGTITPNGGATLVGSPTWTQLVGSNIATITNNHSLTTTVTGLIAGTYIFQLAQTDSNGNTGINTVTITVDAVGNCNCLIYTIPTSTQNN